MGEEKLLLNADPATNTAKTIFERDALTISVQESSIGLPDVVWMKSREAEILEEHQKEFYEAFEGYLAQSRPFVIIYDLQEYQTPSMGQVYDLGTQAKKWSECMEKLQKASVVVLASGFLSSVIRGMVNTINTLIPPVCPTDILYSMEEAENFIAEYWNLKPKEQEQEPQ